MGACCKIPFCNRLWGSKIISRNTSCTVSNHVYGKGTNIRTVKNILKGYNFAKTNMQESVNIDLSEETLNLLNNNNNDSNTIDSLYEELTNIHKDKICSLLTGYCEERGVVYNFKIEKETLNIDNLGKGSFSVNYDINIYSGCKDMNHDKEAQMEIEIIINLTNGSADLIGEDKPERDPDEY